MSVRTPRAARQGPSADLPPPGGGPRSRPAPRERGFTLIEFVIALASFLVVAVGLAGVLTSSIASSSLSRQRTVAQELAMDQIESIRRLPYAEVGTVDGNPPGTIESTRTVEVTGLQATVTTRVSYVNDPTPLSYATAANYKKVSVTVTRVRDGEVLAHEVTYVAPPGRSPYGGIGQAIVTAQLIDLATNTPLEDVRVRLETGPSALRIDATDATGTVTFADLTPNPETGLQAYYDLVVEPPNGYVVLVDDAPPSEAAHVQLGPGQNFATTLRLYRPARIQVVLEQADGSLRTGLADVTVSSSRGSETFAVTGGRLTVTSVAGEPLVPGLEYTVSAAALDGVAPSVTQYVPDDYPTDLDSTFTLVFAPQGTLRATVLWAALPVAGATVTVTGGPESVDLSATTNAEGVATFALPPGDGYTVTATAAGLSVSQGASVAADSTTDVTLSLPTGTLEAAVTWAGAPASGASVTLSGGPQSITVAGTADAGGELTFINVPAGSGYTVTASKEGQSASVGASVVADSTTGVTIALPTGDLRVRARRRGSSVSAATVVVSGGPNGVSVTGTASSSGVITFRNLPAGSGYTVKAYRCNLSSPRSGQASATVSAGRTTTMTVDFTSDTCPL